MLFFSGWVLLGATAHTAKDTGSQLIINKFFGTIINSSFGIATSISIFIRILSNNIIQSATPQIISSSSKVDSQRGIQLVTYLSKYSFFLLFITTLPFLLETEIIIRYWLGNVPIYAVVFCKLMLFTGLIDSLSSSFSAFISASDKIKWFQISSSFVMCGGLLFSFFLFKLGYSPQFISIVYIVTSLLNLIITLFLMNKYLRFNIYYLFQKSYSKVFIVFATTFPLFFVLPNLEITEFRIIYVVIISTIWSISSIFIFGLELGERKSISNYILNFRKS
jgi:O-antigen/teichoic acid export membrane protein